MNEAMPPSAKNTLTFTRFLLRSKSLKLYRDILRTIKKVSNEDYKRDLRIWVREDFERNKNHNDEEVIKYHLSRGKSFHETLLKTLQLSQNSL